MNPVKKSYIFWKLVFDLILSPSPSLKIQIICGKITENLGFESLLRRVENHFHHVLFDFLTTVQDIKKIVKIKDILFCVKNLEIKSKKDKKYLTFRSRDSNPRFSVIFCPQFEFSWKVRLAKSNLGEEVRISWLYEFNFSLVTWPKTVNESFLDVSWFRKSSLFMGLDNKMRQKLVKIPPV